MLTSIFLNVSKISLFVLSSLGVVPLNLLGKGGNGKVPSYSHLLP